MGTGSGLSQKDRGGASASTTTVASRPGGGSSRDGSCVCLLELVGIFGQSPSTAPSKVQAEGSVAAASTALTASRVKNGTSPAKRTCSQPR